jgi:hypothetical protein
MAGPIDARISPTKVNELAQEKPIDWFRANMIGTVPAKFEGRGRRVYPGFLQLCAFMSMNAERHSKSFVDLFHHRIAGDMEKADAIRDFYKEYFAIMDMSAEFYLETVDQVFQRYLLPLGQMRYKGEPIDLRAIKRTFLLTVEGEKDDICAVGQTLAAQDLCSGLRPYMKTHNLQTGAAITASSTASAGRRRSILSCATTSSRAGRQFRPRQQKPNRGQQKPNPAQQIPSPTQQKPSPAQRKQNPFSCHFNDLKGKLLICLSS